MPVSPSIEATQQLRAVSLPSGELEIRVARADLPLDTLCGFATRRNPKRGYLFVSRVLGRHLPVRPAAMRDVHRRLAAKIAADLPGPVVAIGMAETAVCLGQGVHEEYLRRTGRTDVLFLHTTRFRLRQPVAFDFLEEHSHASDHIVYEPLDESDRELMRTARSLILIDDEASTGKTFLNLARAFAHQNPGLERVVSVVITDWMGDANSSRFVQTMPVASEVVSILEGELRFAPSATSTAVDAPNVVGNGGFKDHLIRRNDGRLGRRDLVNVPEQVFDAISVRAGERVLVLGTAEFVYLPYRLAEELDRRGAEAWCAATTRSPIQPGPEIASTLTFADNYQDEIPNFLYNVRAGQFDRVFVCYETPVTTVQADLVRELSATPVLFE